MPESLPAGDVTLELVNDEAIVHDLVIDEFDEVVVSRTDGGETATGTVEFAPGEYTFYCSVPGHRGIETTSMTGFLLELRRVQRGAAARDVKMRQSVRAEVATEPCEARER